MKDESTVDLLRLSVHGPIVYCAQEAWSPKGTIRESIVFGREYDEEKYLQAIYNAGLDDDLKTSNINKTINCQMQCLGG